MRKFVMVPRDLFVKKADVYRMEHEGEEALGFMHVDNPDEYEIINRYAFQPAIKVDENTYKVTFIFK
jgi:hypothetical protein